MSWGIPQVTLSAKAHPAPVRYHPAAAPIPAPIQVPFPAPVVARTVSEAVGMEVVELAQTTLAGWGAGRGWFWAERGAAARRVPKARSRRIYGMYTRERILQIIALGVQVPHPLTPSLDPRPTPVYL